jgi:hypothetical protein
MPFERADSTSRQRRLEVVGERGGEFGAVQARREDHVDSV